MCPPSDQAPAELDQAEAATIPLPNSSPDLPDVVAKNNGDSNTGSAVKADEARDVLAPPPSETETEIAVKASRTGGLATINEQTDSIPSTHEHVTETTTNDESTPKETIGNETPDQTPPTERTGVRPPAEPELLADEVGDNEPAGLALQPNETSVGIKTPETEVATKPAIVVSAEDGDKPDHGSPEALASVSTDTAANDPAESEEHKFVDPNDKFNIGNDVIKFFYTASTRKKPSSPVATAPGCCNPRLHRDSDLYIKAKDSDGKTYVFEVVSDTLEKASPKFEAMIYGSHTRGNKEEWVWELDDNP